MIAARTVEKSTVVSFVEDYNRTRRKKKHTDTPYTMNEIDVQR